MTRLLAAAAALVLAATLGWATPAHGVLVSDSDYAHFQLSHPERGDRALRIRMYVTWEPSTGPGKGSVRKVVLIASDNRDDCQSSLAWEHPVQAHMRYFSIRTYTRRGAYVRDLYHAYNFNLDYCRNVKRFHSLTFGAAQIRFYMTGKARIDEHFDQWFRLKVGN